MLVCLAACSTYTSDPELSVPTPPPSNDGGVTFEGGSTPTGPADAGGGDAEAAVSSSYAAAVLRDAPVAYWRMNLVDDLVANVVPGSPALISKKGVGAAPGAFSNESDGALRFDGTSMVEVADAAAFDYSGNAAFTLECWVLVDLQSKGTLLGKATSGGLGVNGFALYVEKDRNLSFSYGSSGGNVNGSEPVLPEGWHHVALVSDGTAVRSFLDGVLAVERIPNASQRPPPRLQQPLLVGGAPGTALPSFNGTLDEVAIYDRALSAGELTAHVKSASR